MGGRPRRSRLHKNANQVELGLDVDPAWVVYVLCDPRVSDPVERIRYVGVTRVGVDERLKRHLKEARSGRTTHRHCWIRQLLSEGLAPIVEAVDPGTQERAWDRSESAWINHFRSLGCRLTNSCDGGLGVLNPSRETREKISRARCSPGFSAKLSSQEYRSKMSATVRARWEDPDFRVRCSAAQKAVWADPERKAERDALHRAAMARPEVRAKLSAASRASWARRKAAAQAAA